MKTEVAVALIGLSGVIFTALTTIVMQYLQARKPKGSDKIKLIYHPLFVRLKALSTYIEYEFELENKGKEEVFRHLLISKFKIWHDSLFELAKEVESCVKLCNANTCNKLYNINMEHFNKAFEEYNNFFKNTNYTPQEQKCLEIVMEKFNKWNEIRVKSLMDSIANVCDSKFYSDCITKQSIIFDIFIGSFADTVNDAQRTLNEINGDLNGLAFKNKKI